MNESAYRAVKLWHFYSQILALLCSFFFCLVLPILHANATQLESGGTQKGGDGSTSGSANQVEGSAESSAEDEVEEEFSSEKDFNNFKSKAEVQVINKVTAAASKEELVVGQTKNVGNLKITARRCWQSHPSKRVESKLLLEVKETSQKTKEERLVFLGWIFSSSMSAASVEHPVYDILIKKCF